MTIIPRTIIPLIQRSAIHNGCNTFRPLTAVSFNRNTILSSVITHRKNALGITIGLRLKSTPTFTARVPANKNGLVTGGIISQPSSANPNSKTRVSGFRDIMRLFEMARPERNYILLALALILISSGVSMTLPSIIGKLLDRAKVAYEDTVQDSNLDQGNREKDLIYGLTPKQFAFTLCSMFLIGAIANASRSVILKATGERVVARLRTRTMKAALYQDGAFTDKNRVGDLISRLSSDASIVAKSVTQNVSDGARTTIQGVVGFGMMSFISWKLTCVMLVLVPPLGAMAFIYGRKVRAISRQLQETVGDLTKVAEQQLNATKTIQAYASEKLEIRNYAKEVRNVYRIGLKEAVLSGLFFGSTGLVGNFMLISLLYVGTNLIQAGQITVGDLSSFMMYAVYMGSSMFGLSNFFSELMKGTGAATRVFELNDRKPLIHPTTGIDPKTLLKKDIVFHNVSFKYPTRQNHLIFKGLDISIKPGEHVCIVGPSGSGKSTISSLLLRYYDVDEGCIKIGGQDIKSFNLRKLRRLMGVVQQEPLLFNGTILENIVYNVPSEIAEDQYKISKAIGQANCAKFLKNFPEGLKTIVGPRGAQLSGGQKQRIALARAFLLDPALLILDEATSALDSQSESLVAETIHERAARNFTTISIAHRVSTIKNSTRVIVLGKHGSVIETGTFDDLTAKSTSHLSQLLSEQLELEDESFA